MPQNARRALFFFNSDGDKTSISNNGITWPAVQYTWNIFLGLSFNSDAFEIGETLSSQILKEPQVFGLVHVHHTAYHLNHFWFTLTRIWKIVLLIVQIYAWKRLRVLHEQSIQTFFSCRIINFLNRNSTRKYLTSNCQRSSIAYRTKLGLAQR